MDNLKQIPTCIIQCLFHFMLKPILFYTRLVIFCAKTQTVLFASLFLHYYTLTCDNILLFDTRVNRLKYFRLKSNPKIIQKTSF